MEDDGMDFGPVTNRQPSEVPAPGTYLVKLMRFEKEKDGQFGPRRRWVFALADAATKTPIYSATGGKAEFVMTTSTSLGKKATARRLFQGLLGRELEEGADGRAVAQEALGKTATVFIGPNENNWTEIISFIPQNGNGTSNTPAPKAAEPVAAGVADDPFA